MICTLCGLDSGSSSFCCAGCRNVYAILMESGILASGQNPHDTPLFQESLRLGLISNRAREESRAIPEDAETREKVFHLTGMWCTACGWLIEHALAGVNGIRSAEVLFASDLLKVRYCPQYLPPGRIAERIARLGYRAEEYRGQTGASDAERNDLLLRVGIAAFLWMNVMTFSLVLYAGYFQQVTASFRDYVPFVLLTLATPAVFYCAAPVLRIAWKGVRLGVLRMESLLALGILTTYGYSAAHTFARNPHVYFDTVCAIVALVLTGKAIERGAKERTARAVTLLYRLMPNKARLVVDTRERFVAVDALQPGAVFRVKSGERIAADGIVIEGRSHADESVLTGESVPRPKAPGDPVVCGSLNTGGVLEIRATRVGASSTLAQMVRTVEQAAGGRTRIEQSVDQVSRRFIPAVLLLALMTLAGWTLRTGQPAEALMHAIAVLVIACPCALGIATPLALAAAVSAAARRGILVSDARVLETIHKVDVLVMDKTGTATEGVFTVLETGGDASRMAELAALESRSEHPIGKAIVRHVDAEQFPEVRDVTVRTGMGIAGHIGEADYFIGSREMAKEMTGDLARSLRAKPDTTAAEVPPTGLAPEAGPQVYFGWDGVVRGWMRFGDRVRPEASSLCAELRRRAIRTVLLSGDSRAATAAVAAAMGAAEWHAEATPEHKIETLRRYQHDGSVVAMIGDGVNDAPSLAQADLGIALASGADIAMHAAPLVLMNNSLMAVVETIDLAGRTFHVVRQNLFWAFAYNVVGISLAVTGVLNPILASGAMVLSSFSVIANSRRLAAK